jgi:hypothetical protein
VRTHGYLTGILARESDFCWNWRPAFGAFSISCLLTDHGNSFIFQAAKDVRASQDILIDIFERIENFFRRLETYAEVPPTPEMMDIIMKIMVEVLCILAIATKEIKQSRMSERCL